MSSPYPPHAHPYQGAPHPPPYQGHQGQGFPHPNPYQGFPPPQPVAQCRLCGCVPAAPVTFRSHRGLLVVMQFLSMEGPFCRYCGLAVFRDMTAKSLIMGWYGVLSLLINPLTVLVNLVLRSKVAALPAPVPPNDGRPSGRPLDPGQPLMFRPIAIVGAALPFLVLLLAVLVNL